MNAPKLRFKEFNDEWISQKLFKLVEFSKGNILAKADLDETGNYPCILYGQLYTKYNEVIREIYSKTNRNENNIPKSKKGDVLIPSSGETPIDISTSSCIQIDNVLLGGDINILRPISCDGRFLSYLINNNKKTEIAKVAQGHSVVHLYNDNLKQVSINIPSVQEQKRISDTLELLDKKIELQSKKIEDLKLFKLSKYSSVFSKTNNKIKLSDICIIEKGKQINSDLLIENGNYYMLNGGILPSGYLNEYNTNENTITISEGGNSCGYVNFNKTKFWCGGHCYKIISPSVNTFYLYHLLKYNEKKIMDLRVGSGLPNIQKKDLEALKLSINKNDEQLKIGILFDTFDKKINLETNKLDKLQELKKGLMQSMFV